MHLCTLERNDKNICFFLYVLHEYSQDLVPHTHAQTRTRMQLQAKYLENMYAHIHVYFKQTCVGGYLGACV